MTMTIDERISLIASRLFEAEKMSELGQTFTVYGDSAAVHIDHNSPISDEYLYFTEDSGSSFDASIQWPAEAVYRETFETFETIGDAVFFEGRIRPYVEAGGSFRLQLQVVEDLAHTDSCGGSDDSPGTGGDGCMGDHDWPAWALMIAGGK